MSAVRWDERPRLRRPILIAAFEGWNDAADGASTAARYLARAWGARPFGAIDPEEFYDFTVTRPQVRLVDGVTRRIDWPEARLAAASLPGKPHDVVFLHAAEPQLRWRTFAATVVGVATALDVELAVTLGALLADVPHTHPVRVTGTAANQQLATRLGLQRSRYEGPTGIVGVLQEALGRAGIASASLWATVPHYVSGTPSPKATLALVERATALLGVAIDTVDLEVAASAYERQVSEVVADDEDMAAYVRRLEDQDSEEEVPDVPSPEELADEVERFLREQPPTE